MSTSNQNLVFEAEYLGGHLLFPKRRDVKLIFEEEQLKIEEKRIWLTETNYIYLDLKLPYGQIKSVKNIIGEKSEPEKAVLFGLFSLLMRQTKPFLMISYNDETINQELELIFDVKKIEEVQRILYAKLSSIK